MPGWTIFADMDPWNTQMDPGEPSAVTGPDGSYSLAGLAPGIYSVYEVAQSAWQCTCPISGAYGITINAGDLYDHMDFGNYQEGGTPSGSYDLRELCLVFDLDIAGVGQSSVTVTGNAVMEVSFEGPTPGAAMDNNGNGRDELAAQLTSLDLIGIDPFFGTVKIGLDPGVACDGQLEEQANVTPGVLDLAPFTAAGQADSFFDVFFEIELVDLGVTLRTAHAKRIEAILDGLPAA
jgi:hypothetical protein